MRARSLYFTFFVCVAVAACSTAASPPDAPKDGGPASDAGPTRVTDAADAGAMADDASVADAAEADANEGGPTGDAGSDATTITCTVDGWCNELPLGGFVHGNGTYIMTFTSVWSSAPGDVWVFGTGAAHFDGHQWIAPYPGINAGQFNDVWGTSQSDVWAGGASTTNTAEHWNGTAWAPSAIGAFLVTGIWGSAANDVWAVGGGNLERWNGATWSLVDGGSSGVVMDAVWGSGPNDVWGVGNAGDILHWDGNAWSGPIAVQPSDAGPAQDAAAHFGYGLCDVWGASPSDVWAVGGNCGGEFGYGIILHWDGSAWSVSLDYVLSSLVGVWGTAPDDVWAVGKQGTILHWNGTSWSPEQSGTMDDLASIWGTSPNDVWVVGGTTILHRM